MLTYCKRTRQMALLYRVGAVMNGLDLSAISFLNHFAHISGTLNRVLSFSNQSDLLSWLPVTSALWWVWFRKQGQESRNRRLTLSIILGCALVIGIFYIVQESGISVPFRARPQFNSEVNFQMPDGVKRPTDPYWAETSSFPSGHSAILSVFTFGLLLISPRIGGWCLIYSAFLCALRMYFGFHYATDIISGALLGIAMFSLANAKPVAKLLAGHVLDWANTYPSLFYVAFFIATFDIATGFSESRTLIHVLKKL